jgi:hypothetical protein
LSSPWGSRFGRLFGSGFGDSTIVVFPATDDDWTVSIPEVSTTRPSILPESRNSEPRRRSLW